MPGGGFGHSLSTGVAFNSLKLVVTAPRVTEVIEYAFFGACGTRSFADSRERLRRLSDDLARAALG
eukprot:7379696-Prymnesium_polylepis.2